MNTRGFVFVGGRKRVEQFKALGTKAALEAYTRDELDEDDLVAALLLHCRQNLTATTDALLLVDEYHRRGMLDTCVYLNAKTELNMLLFRSAAITRTTHVDGSGKSALDQFSSGMMD